MIWQDDRFMMVRTTSLIARWSATLVCAYLFLPVASQADQPVHPPPCLSIDDFSSSDLGEFPQGWTARHGNEWSLVRGFYVIAGQDSATYLAASTDTRNKMIMKDIKLDILHYPILRWRWRAHVLPSGGDERESETNDSAAGIYVVFRVQNLLWKKVPTIIKYTWSTSAPVGTQTSRGFDRFTVRVEESGEENLGEWVTEEVDLVEHYRSIFGHDPNRRTVGIGLFTDQDNTRSSAAADYDDIVIMTRPAAQSFRDTHSPPCAPYP